MMKYNLVIYGPPKSPEDEALAREQYGKIVKGEIANIIYATADTTVAFNAFTGQSTLIRPDGTEIDPTNPDRVKVPVYPKQFDTMPRINDGTDPCTHEHYMNQQPACVMVKHTSVLDKWHAWYSPDIVVPELANVIQHSADIDVSETHITLRGKVASSGSVMIFVFGPAYVNWFNEYFEGLAKKNQT